ncbi:MAG TPA: PorP/SprF family type IX secretion system membrane protein [Puia sp.]|nr:PorP/SprF family type IX secretion system membrane protein [Puia sp.]
MKKLWLIFFVGSMLSNAVQSQDPAFSQFFASPLTLNPALTGKFNGVLRVAGNYRNQWPSINNAYITSTVSVDAGIFRGHLPETDTWGVGMMIMSDKTASGILTSNYASISTSYHKSVDEDGMHQIGVGFQGTYATRMLNGPRLRFMDGLQLDGSWLPSPTEPINSEEITAHYFDMNVGALYNGSFENNNSIYFGASLYHINQPKESFMGVDNIILPTRLTIHAGGYFPSSNSNTTLYVSGLFSSQATAKEYVLGGALEVNANNDEKSPVNVYLGSWVRFSNVADAIIPYVGLDYGSFSLGMTYDVNISAFRKATLGRGGIEISLIYITKPSSDDHHRDTQCPRF